MCNHKINSLAYFLLLASFLVISAMGDSSEETDECAAQLAGLTTCLSYVSGESKAPTPDCCSGLKQVLKTNKKCLCFIIKHRNDPDLGSLQINVTLALRLPTVCNAPTNVSKCPELLHMDPKSQEAQVFYQLNNGSSKGGTSPAPSPSGLTSGSSQASNLTQKSDAFCEEKRLFGIEILAAWLLVGLCFYWACNGII